LLLALSAVEDRVQLGNYARRLNYVSDALAAGVRGIMARSPDPQRTYVAVMNGDDHFVLAWYFAQETHNGGVAAPPSPPGEPHAPGRRYRVYSPEPHVAAKGGAGESVEELILRLIKEASATNQSISATTPPPRLYLFSYFEHQDAGGVFTNLARRNPEEIGRVTVEKIIQQEIITAVWEIRPKAQSSLGR
jgi:hypothetical protein